MSMRPASAVLLAGALVALAAPRAMAADAPGGTCTGTQTSGEATPVLTGPTTCTVPAGGRLRIPGLTVSDPKMADNPGAMSLDVTAGTGKLAMTANGAPVSGSGAPTFRLQSPLAGTNEALGTLTYEASGSPGTDTLVLNLFDQGGSSSSLTVAVTVAESAGARRASVVSDSSGITATRAQDLINGFGINTHLDACCNAYGADYRNLAGVIGAINYIGHVKLLRDFAEQDSVLTIWPHVAQATGVKFAASISEGDRLTYMRDLARMRRLRKNNIIAFYEGGNEPDATYAQAHGDSLALAAEQQKSVWEAGKQDGVPVIQTSFGVVYPRSHYGTTGDLSAYADYGNSHDYPASAPNVGGIYGTGAIDWMNREAHKTTPGKPVISTEFGYTVPASSAYGHVSLANQAIYTLEYIFGARRAGNPYYFYYALLDDISGTWGLFDAQFQPRPVATALKNAFTLLADRSPTATGFVPGKLKISVSGMPRGGPNAGGRFSVFQKSNGEFWIELCNEQKLNNGAGPDLVVPPVKVNVDFGGPMREVTMYDPITNGTAPVQSWTNLDKQTVNLPSHPILLKLVR